MYHYNTDGCLPKPFNAIRISNAIELALCRSFFVGIGLQQKHIIIKCGTAARKYEYIV